jgi:ribonuclease P protein component
VGAEERPDRFEPGDAKVPEGRRFPSSSRIRRSGDIRELFRRGRRRRTAHLDVFLAASPVSRPRVGVVVPKHGHDNVERNKLKRRLKELARTRVLPGLWECGGSLDVLVRARREAYEAVFAELREELDDVLEETCSGLPSSG